MKKIVNVNRLPVMVDTDTCDIVALSECCRGIDSIYIIPCDAKMHWEQKNENPINIDVNKDDILITFYDPDLGKNFTVVKSEDWKNMLNHAKDEAQKRKESWASKKCSDCDCCDGCSNRSL